MVECFQQILHALDTAGQHADTKGGTADASPGLPIHILPSQGDNTNQKGSKSEGANMIPGNAANSPGQVVFLLVVVPDAGGCGYQETYAVVEEEGVEQVEECPKERQECVYLFLSAYLLLACARPLVDCDARQA